MAAAQGEHGQVHELACLRVVDARTVRRRVARAPRLDPGEPHGHDVGLRDKVEEGVGVEGCAFCHVEHEARDVGMLEAVGRHAAARPREIGQGVTVARVLVAPGRQGGTVEGVLCRDVRLIRLDAVVEPEADDRVTGIDGAPAHLAALAGLAAERARVQRAERPRHDRSGHIVGRIDIARAERLKGGHVLQTRQPFALAARRDPPVPAGGVAPEPPKAPIAAAHQLAGRRDGLRRAPGACQHAQDVEMVVAGLVTRVANAARRLRLGRDKGQRLVGRTSAQGGEEMVGVEAPGKGAALVQRA